MILNQFNISRNLAVLMGGRGGDVLGNLSRRRWGVKKRNNISRSLWMFPRYLQCALIVNSWAKHCGEAQGEGVMLGSRKEMFHSQIVCKHRPSLFSGPWMLFQNSVNMNYQPLQMTGFTKDIKQVVIHMAVVYTQNLKQYYP